MISLTSSMLLHDVIMTSHSSQRYAVSGNDFVLWHTAPRSCNSWTAASRNAKLFAPKLWPPNSPDVSAMDYKIWAVMQHHVYHRKIHSMDELKRLLIDVWCGLEWSIFDEAIDQWPGRHQACVHAKGGRVQPVNWQCWLCPYLLHSMWLVWLTHL